MRALLFSALVACSGSPSTPSTAPVHPEPPKLARVEYVVVPAELLDAGVLERIPHRVRVRRFGSAWLRDDANDSKRSHREGDSDSIFPVIGETKTKIRVVFEDDHARLALWIARADTWQVIATPIQLSDRDGHIARDAGVWVVRGAPAHTGARIGGRREVHLRDDSVALAGFVPDSVLANVWVADKSDPKISFKQPSYESWEPLKDNRQRVKLAVDTKVRASAAADAPVIATITADSVIAYLAASTGDDREVEIPRPYARVRGHVRAREVEVTDDLFAFHGSGTGHGFGMSHADRIDVPPGTCLFDRIEGDVVGVQSELSTRYGSRRPYNARTGTAEAPRWSQVYVGTSWTTTSVYIRDTSDDPKDPIWESCTQPVHR